MKINVNQIGLILGPLLYVVALYYQDSGYLDPDTIKVLGVAVWMVVWWVSDAAPMAVTALLPIILFSTLGIFSLKEATSPYASPIIFLFMGGFLLALGLEAHGLHRRIALNLIKISGTSANGIILGFMIATAFLSMWISNTATTIMMLPIALSVIDLVKNDTVDVNRFKHFSTALLLGIAYSANIGGFATIIGTPPNVVFVGLAQEILNVEISFADWMMVGTPLSILLLIITYFLLTKVLHNSRLGKIEDADIVIQNELKKLGKWKREEILVASIFALTASMWIFKTPINSLLGEPILNDTFTAMMGGILMFIMPADKAGKKKLVYWKETQRLPWGILILFGGGMTLAKAMESTGLVHIIADSITQNPTSVMFTFFILITMMVFFTELMSNVALATVFIPIVIAIALKVHIDPILLAIPVTMGASCAFMMPVATPPNAIVFSSGHITIAQMIRVGFWLNLISILVLLVGANSIIEWIFT